MNELDLADVSVERIVGADDVQQAVGPPALVCAPSAKRFFTRTIFQP